MKQKILLILLVACLSSSAFAQTAVWNPVQNPFTSGLWTEGANWSGTEGIAPNNADTKVVFNVPGAEECILDALVLTLYFVIGDGGETEQVLRVVNGGTLSSGANWAGIGWTSPGKLIVEKGGTVNFGEHLWNGWESVGTIIIDGGTINVTGMYGTAFEGNAGSGGTYVKNGGILNLAQIHPEKSIPAGSLLDISGGTVTIVGDQQGIVNAYIAAEKITAFEGNGVLTVSFDAGTNLTTITGSGVTFNVDLGAVTDLYAGGKVWTVFGDWASYYEMTDSNLDGIYTVAVQVNAGTSLKYSFAYQNGSDATNNRLRETVPAECSDGNGHRVLEVTGGNITLDSVLFGSCTAAPAPQQAATTVWNPAANPKSRGLWKQAANWTDGFVPNENKVVFNVTGAPPCILNENAVTFFFVLGDGGDSEQVLRVVNGGNLSTGANWAGVAWTSPGKLIVENGGTVTFGEHLWLGWESNAICELVGGTINVTGMYGTAFEGNAGTGAMYVKSGVLNLAQLHPEKSIPAGSFMDITGGTVNIVGDLRDIVNAYIALERIVANEGNDVVTVVYDAEKNLTILTGPGSAVLDIQSEFSNKVYPNPTEGILHIENPSAERFSYALYSSTGELMSRQQNVEGSKAQVDLSGFSKGIYILDVRTLEKSMKHRIILK